ncbi:MAG TPA: CDP-diacylglycerol--glycerol-3-phosphate 3-phosphatidyltransferase [Deltaproteobacteria bacterium]|nr:CDP-diacylglycerol--glycerol-3-phosphate 3-phosphatidyltransferase [Deltaproteobacteria bacterium]HPR56495.1 CDP-diacylglycerol--glycerol-3-phosphate 3-phosphatidyltransferase [Deltaproteobacteria bacterium]HXK48451.1 CDP-diacylglycerol--glycerol-3-phosphate 3-phosphatidyltransferase [Deltaproteobacteria bacterium]
MNISNALTVSRIFMVPVIALLIIRDDLIQSVIAAVIFSAAMVTDYLDGYFARKYHIESDLGKLLDPLADKFLIGTVLIMLIPLGRAPAWIVAMIVARELAVTGLRSIAAEKNIIIAADWVGKYKTAFQCVALIPLLVHHTIPLPFIDRLQFQLAGEFFLWIALFFTLWSGVDYFVRYAKAAS